MISGGKKLIISLISGNQNFDTIPYVPWKSSVKKASMIDFLLKKLMTNPHDYQRQDYISSHLQNLSSRKQEKTNYEQR